MNAMPPEAGTGTGDSLESLRQSALPREVALDLARAGIPVFPCRPDKKPYTANGFKDATTDPSKVAAFWQANPRAMIGVPTGQASGLFVVDLDTEKDTGEALGEASLADLGLSHLLTGPGATTPSGGRHLYFRADGRAVGLGSTAKRIGPGIDTRGNGGYVIAPGSTAPAGAYVACNGTLTTPATLPPLPQALLKALQHPAKARATVFRSDTGASLGLPDERAEVAEVEAILGNIPPDCGYGDWLVVLMGLHDHFNGSGAGLDVADTWSAKGAKYHPGDVAEKWRGFKSGGGTGWGSVCDLARQNGADLSAIARDHRKSADLPALKVKPSAQKNALYKAKDPGRPKWCADVACTILETNPAWAGARDNPVRNTISLTKASERRSAQARAWRSTCAAMRAGAISPPPFVSKDLISSSPSMWEPMMSFTMFPVGLSETRSCRSLSRNR